MSVINNIDNELVFKAIKNAQSRALLVTAEQFASGVRRRTPVKTGNLKASIEPTGRVTETRDKLSTEVPAKANYAKFIEFGTVKIEPRAMYRRTESEDKGSLLRTMGSLSKF